MLKTIQEVFAFNLKRLRGERTQQKMAEVCGVAYPSYQRMEAGDIPQRPNLEKLAKGFGVPETALFKDPDLARPTPEEALLVLAEAIRGRQVSEKLQPIITDLDAIGDDEEKLRTIAGFIRRIRTSKPLDASKKKGETG